MRHARTAAFVLIAITLALASIFMWQSRREEIGRAKTTTINFVQLLRAQSQAVFQASDLALRIIKARLENRPSLAVNDPDFQTFLRRLTAEQPYVRALFVIGPDGFITHDTDYPETPRVSLADRGYFIAHQRDPSLGVRVGRPVLSRSVDSWFVPLSRRVNGPDGSFGGVVVAAVEPRFFEHIYRQLSLSEHHSVALYHADGTFIARAPDLPDLYGRKWSEGPLFTEYLRRSSTGFFTGETFAGSSAMIAYATVEGFPLVVTTSLDLDAALAGWRGTAWVVGFGVLFIASLILLLVVTLNRRRLEIELAQQRALMAHRLETVGQMTRSVAHDFNNVLAVVSAGVGLIQKRGATENFLEAIQQAVERGSSLTAGLLDFAKRQEHDRRSEDPAELLRSLDVVMRQLAGKNVAISTRYANGCGNCLINRSQFDACILNLIANASHAMPDGGAIAIAAQQVPASPGDGLQPGRYAHIQIADTGSGMDQGTLDRVFEPFFTTKAEGGTGLGLTQVRTFVRQMGGDVRISSELGAGTRIDLYFPCVAADGPAGADGREGAPYGASAD